MIIEFDFKREKTHTHTQNRIFYMKFYFCRIIPILLISMRIKYSNVSSCRPIKNGKKEMNTWKYFLKKYPITITREWKRIFFAKK